MGNIILSLLIFKSMTIYEIRGYIQKNLSTVCSDSLGSIQIAIKNLMQKGFIRVDVYREKGMLKKKYSITESGVASYRGWIGTPIDLSKVKDMESGKLFFLGVAPKEKKVAFLEEHIKGLRNEYEKLCLIKSFVDEIQKDVIEQNVERIKGEPMTAQNISEVSGGENLRTVLENTYRYQVYMLDYGLMRAKADIAFFEDVLRSESDK